LLAFQTQLESQLTTLEWLSANQWIDGLSEFFPAFRPRSFSMSTPPSVDAMNTTRRLARSTTAPRYSSLAMSVRIQPGSGDRLAQRVSLVGHQTLAQPGFSESADIFFAVYNFNAASFTAAASMNLTFNHPRAGADFGCGFFRFTRCGTGVTGWCRHAIPSKQLFCLIFV
jgi:hypothetical protein